MSPLPSWVSQFAHLLAACDVSVGPMPIATVLQRLNSSLHSDPPPFLLLLPPPPSAQPMYPQMQSTVEGERKWYFREMRRWVIISSFSAGLFVLWERNCDRKQSKAKRRWRLMSYRFPKICRREFPFLGREECACRFSEAYMLRQQPHPLKSQKDTTLLCANRISGAKQCQHGPTQTMPTWTHPNNANLNPPKQCQLGPTQTMPTWIHPNNVNCNKKDSTSFYFNFS